MDKVKTFFTSIFVMKCQKKQNKNQMKIFNIQLVIQNHHYHSGQAKCNKQREETDDPNSVTLPDKTNDPDAGLPTDPETFKPVIPTWPTPTGKTEESARGHCEMKIKESKTYTSCHRVLGGRFSVNGAVDQCVADALVNQIFLYSVIDILTSAMQNKTVDK